MPPKKTKEEKQAADKERKRLKRLDVEFRKKENARARERREQANMLDIICKDIVIPSIVCSGPERTMATKRQGEEEDPQLNKEPARARERREQVNMLDIICKDIVIPSIVCSGPERTMATEMQSAEEYPELNKEPTAPATGANAVEWEGTPKNIMNNLNDKIILSTDSGAAFGRKYAEVVRMRKKRKDTLYKEHENQSAAKRMRKLRTNTRFKLLDNQRKAIAISKARFADTFRMPEKEAQKVLLRQKRKNLEFRATENRRRLDLIKSNYARQKLRFALAQKRRRQNIEKRKNENKRKIILYLTSKPNEERKKERNRQKSSSARKRRDNPESRSKEASRRAIARFEAAKRRLNFDDLDAKSKYAQLFEKYCSEIRQQPIYICSCCGGSLYESSTVKVSVEKLLRKGRSDEFIEKLLHVHQSQHRLCRTCNNHVSNIKNKDVPRMCLANGLDFPRIPSVLKDLNRLEERLISPRLPFMQIRLRGYEKQWALKGNVVNVENNLDRCVNVLPRQFHEASVIQLKLKLKSSYAGHYIYDKIRPDKVLKALKYLLTTPLYKKHGVVLSEHWDKFNADEVPFLVEKDCDDDERVIKTVQNADDTDITDDIGAEESLIYTDPDPCSYGTQFAPGEGKIPIPLNKDPEAEYLSFPSIYCGQEATYNKKLSTTDIAKSELRRFDRRCAKPEKILYMFRKSCNEKIYDAFHICLRQKRKGHNDRLLTAGDLRTQEKINSVIAKDDGYAVFQNIRSSPAYWKGQCKRLVSMVRQLGGATLFITGSAAETKWNELLVTLAKLVDKVDLTEEDAAKLDSSTKARLISSDPATCVTHFNHKYKALLNHLLKQEHGAFAPYHVDDHYSRVEYQMRGSPHTHGLYWVKDAPRYIPGDQLSEKACVEFIDKYITCRRDENGEMRDLIGYQIHKHSHTCKKGGRSINNCRFGYPKPPLIATMILHPLRKDFDKKKLKSIQETYKQIINKLSSMGPNFKEKIPLPDFLQAVGCDEELYLLALRSSIKRSTVFLRRETDEILINAYNRDIMIAWRANMDIQFVLDAYACAKYCAGYILKSEGGVSKLLRAAAKDAKNGNQSVREKLTQFATILIKGSEISAQEAAAFILGLPNTHSSRADVYINTGKLSDRIGILKTTEELQELPDECEDVCQKGLIDHYTQRPQELENVCLADFASLFTFHKKNKSDLSNIPSKNDNEDLDQKKFVLLDDSGYMQKRKIRKIIRFRHFNKADQANYWREQLMLFVPWRDEERELSNGNSLVRAEEKMDLIKQNSRPYYDNREVDDGLLGQYIHDLEGTIDANEMEDPVQNQMEIVNGDDNYVRSYLTGQKTKGTVKDNFLAPRAIHPREYFEMMQQLNLKQRKIVMHVTHCLKTSKTPFHIFLTGGAGVGKSRVVTAIVQTYLRYNNMLPNTKCEDIGVLVSAPTGKAAFNVFGMTLHCAFKLPPTQFGGNLAKLDGSTRNSLRLKYLSTLLFIIDEISMVSCKMLGWIDQRLRELFDPNLPFGGKSILVVGHLRQLPPIPGGASQHVFKVPPSHPHAALLNRNPLWELFQFYELDEIMRQKGDFEFCKALNNMSEGCMDEADIILLRSREIGPNLKPPDEAVWLFEFNKDCQAHNQIIHSKLKTDSAISFAFDKVTGSASQEQKERFLDDAKGFTTQESDGIPYQTNLQVGGIYFITTNIDVSDGLFNGATGVLKKIDYGTTIDKKRVPTTAWILFENSLIGSNHRANNRFKYINNIPLDWTPIERITRTLSKSYKYSGMDLIRSQLPLVAANAMTIAKSQGSSMSLVVVSTKRKLSREKLYVACSRATSLKGLFISGSFTPPNHPGNNDDVSREITTLRKKPVQFSQQFFIDVNSKYKLYYQNIENFPKYRQDVLSDPNVMSSTILVFVEPHIKVADNTQLPGFNQIAKKYSHCTSNGTTNSEGYLIYSKDESQVSSIECHSKKFGGHHFELIKFECHNMHIIVCYRKPDTSITRFLSVLKGLITAISGNILVIGDANIGIRHQNINLPGFFKDLGLTSLLNSDEATTNYGTQIDICYCNDNSVVCCIAETYYGYHKGLCVNW